MRELQLRQMPVVDPDEMRFSNQFGLWQKYQQIAQVDEVSIRAQIDESKKCQQMAQRRTNKLQRILDSAESQGVSVAAELAGINQREERAKQRKRLQRRQLAARRKAQQ